MRPFGITVLSLILVSISKTAAATNQNVPIARQRWQSAVGMINATNTFQTYVADQWNSIVQTLGMGSRYTSPATPLLTLNLREIEVSTTDQSFKYDHEKFCTEVCKLSLDGFTENDRLSLIVKKNNRSGLANQRDIQFKLLDILFESAIVTYNNTRIDELIAKSIHLHLTDVEKVGFFKLVLGKFNKTVQPGSNLHKILKSLLKNNFYIPNHELKEKGYMVYDWDCPLYSVIADPNLVSVFQNVDLDFFKKENKCNYVKRAIRFSDYSVVDQALNAGCNPRIVDEDGLNALDELMANSECDIVLKPEHAEYFKDSIIKACKDDKERKSILLKRFEDDTDKVYPSFDLKNLRRCCDEKRLHRADFILTKAKEADEFKDAKTCEEVIRIALKTEDVLLSVKALKLCLDKLPANKVSSLITDCLNGGTSIPTEIHEIFDNRLNHNP